MSIAKYDLYVKKVFVMSYSSMQQVVKISPTHSRTQSASGPEATAGRQRHHVIVADAVSFV